jgi:hypothetical protein
MRDREGLEKAPQVIREELDQAAGEKCGVSSSTLEALDETEVMAPGHKYPLPELPLASDLNLKHRYDPIVQLVTNLMMRHGKLSVAQRVGLSASWSGWAIIRTLIQFRVEHVIDTSTSPNIAAALT